MTSWWDSFSTITLNEWSVDSYVMFGQSMSDKWTINKFQMIKSQLKMHKQEMNGAINDHERYFFVSHDRLAPFLMATGQKSTKFSKE